MYPPEPKVKHAKAKQLIAQRLNFFESDARIAMFDFGLEASVRQAHLLLQNRSELAQLDPDDPYNVLEFFDDCLLREGESFEQYRKRDTMTPIEVGEGETPLVKGICLGPGAGLLGRCMVTLTLPSQKFSRESAQYHSQL